MFKIVRKLRNPNHKDYFALESGRVLASFGDNKNFVEMGNKNQIFKAIENLRKDFKQEVSDLRQDIKQEVSNLRQDFKQELSDLRQDFKQEVSDLRQELSRRDIKISDTKIELTKDINALNVDTNKQIAGLVKWVVGFGITILVTLISLFLSK